jgi:hypothetical protein
MNERGGNFVASFLSLGRDPPSPLGAVYRVLHQLGF